MTHFTEAEMAAELYRQMTRACAESGIAHIPESNGDMTIIPGDALVYGPVRRETARLGVLKRFAMLPPA